MSTESNRIPILLWTLLVSFALAACGPQPLPEKKTATPADTARAKLLSQRAVTLVTRDNFRFEPAVFEVPANRKITITLKNEGVLPRDLMAENLVILRPGSDVNAFLAEAAFADENDYIPPVYESQILAKIRSLAGGQSDQVTFKTPKEPGEYPFLCTWPGHAAAGMKGVMRVVAVDP